MGRSCCNIAMFGCLIAVAACGPDLGDGDTVLATRVIYREGAIPYYEGQAMVEAYCANTQCHSSTATGTARTGVPAGLDFDAPVTTTTENVMTRLRGGIASIRDHGEEMWGEVEEGSMPPGEAGKRNLGRWLYSINGQRPAGGLNMLPDLGKASGKELLRNWLAAGAPVVAGTADLSLEMQQQALEIGDVLPSFGTALQATWSSIYQNLIAGKGCTACHSPDNPTFFPSATTLNLHADADGGALAAHAALVNAQPNPGGPCAGRGFLVVPMDCRNSLLWQKLQARENLEQQGIALCGDTMPLGATGSALTSQMQLDVLCQWIMMGAPPN